MILYLVWLRGGDTKTTQGRAGVGRLAGGGLAGRGARSAGAGTIEREAPHGAGRTKGSCPFVGMTYF